MNEIQELLLNILSHVLFSEPIGEYELSPELLKEARLQAVCTLLPNLKDKKFLTLLSKNARLHSSHQKLHGVLSAECIPYVILKGSASARYYPSPVRRAGGDIDIFVRGADFERTINVLLKNGYETEDSGKENHAVFQAKSGIVLELHRRINGANEKISGYFSNLLEKAEECDGMMVPSPFHHCFILLCHMAHHITHEGIGLRHLCDWAVFAANVDVGQWESELKDCGLWRFAQIMSQLCVNYLHMPYRACYGAFQDDILPVLMEDILIAGNFGQKDYWGRRQQIKYISADHDRDMQSSAFISAFKSLRAKAHNENKSVFRVAADYGENLIKGKRKADTFVTVQNAKRRKNLYRKLRLFKTEN